LNKIPSISLCMATFLLSGCFWKSSPPDLSAGDTAAKLTVIWDQRVSEDTIRRESWHTIDPAILERLVPTLDTRAWTSSTVLPACHPTRYILKMQSGRIWEICQGFDQPTQFAMFDRTNPGWSGHIPRPQAFLTALARRIEADKGFTVDLLAEYRTAIRTGAVSKIVPDDTWAVLKEYPGYPEVVWNTAEKRWEYLGD